MVFTFWLVMQRFGQLLSAPFKNPNMLWIVLPLILTLLVINLYFGKYKDEKIGWNSALTNTLVLIFVSLNLFQYVFSSRSFFEAIKSTGFFIALFVFILGMVLLLLDFFHLIPDRVAMTISAHLPINIAAYLALAIVYANIVIDLNTIIACIFLILFFVAFFYSISLTVYRKTHAHGHLR